MKTRTLLFAALACLWLGSCRKYLDAKPDRSLAVPSTLQDYQAILDDQNFNILYPYAADVASDNYFVSADDWASFSLDGRNNYVWDPQSANDQDWGYAYLNVLAANIVLEGIDQVPSADAGSKSQVKGSAYFFRGYLFAQLANCFTPPYIPGGGAGPGIPLKVHSDINEKITRATLEETYRQIISDLKQAAALLPAVPLVRTRPSKPAAFGALARVYLSMQDYQNAGLYADSCLRQFDQLTDYNTLDTASAEPFERFNDEVIFYATSTGTSQVAGPFYARVDTALYASYSGNDLRRALYYTPDGNGHYSFKGDHTAEGFGQLFDGVATNEVLLMRAECAARLGQAGQAVADLNRLLQNRYLAGTFAPYPGTMGTEAALELVLAERRKELAFRSGLRWLDLRRLNQDSRFAKTLVRKLGGQTYTLAPGDKRYAFLLPVSVVQLSGVPQNSR